MSIILNISGRIFNVSKDTISKSQLFSGILADCVIDNEIIIHRSAKLFEHVYSYLLDDRYPYPKKYYSELDYYLVPYDMDSLYDPDKTWQTEYDKLNSKISKMENILNLTIDESIASKMKNLSHRCSYPMCYNQRRYPDGVCYEHRSYCCHQFYDEISLLSVKSCKNKSYRSGIYCENHFADYLL
jgi:hypothetical protein